MRNLGLLAVVVLGSCASGPSTMTLPDGRVAHMAYCDGRRDSIASCFNEAAKTCGGAYDIVDRTEGSSLAAMEDMAVTIPKRSIAYVCKG